MGSKYYEISNNASKINITMSSDVSKSKPDSDSLIVGVVPLPKGLALDKTKKVALKIDDNDINSYGNKTAKSGSKYYPRTQWSVPAFENEEARIVFDTPKVGDTAKGEKFPDDLKPDVDPEWVNTQTIGIKMDPDHEKNADMYKIGVSVGEFMENDIFRREYGKKKYTKTKPGDKGIIMYDSKGEKCIGLECNKLIIPRAQKFGVIVRHWNIDTKDKNKPDGVHIEAYVDPANDGKWQKYIEVDDVGQFKNDNGEPLNPIINPNFEQKVQARLDEAKAHWEQNVVESEIRPIVFDSGKDFILWPSTTLK